MTSEILYLVVRLGADRYAVEASSVVEVVPVVRLKALPGAPVGVAGVMNYRDEAIPVIDLNLIATATATMRGGGARIVLVTFAAAEDRRGVVGLLVPEVTETVRLRPDAFTSPGVATDDTPYLGPVLTTAAGVLQRVSVSALLTPELVLALFPMRGAA